jgi:hypothetical protein
MAHERCNAGLDERCRDNNGTIRRKRSDTQIGTLRQEYGDGFAAGMRSDATLGTLLERSGAESLTEYLRRKT